MYNFYLMERFDFVPVSVVALAKCDLSSLRLLGSGGVALGKETSEMFTAKFPKMWRYLRYGDHTYDNEVFININSTFHMFLLSFL